MADVAGEPVSLRQAVTWSAAAGGLTFVYSAFPYLFDSGHVIADVIHGNAIGYALAATLLVAFATTLMRGIRRRESEGRGVASFVGMLFAGLFVLGLAVILALAGRDYRLATDLAARGVPAQARLSGSFVDSCGKTGCSSVLRYDFVPRGSAVPVHGSADEQNGGPEYDYAVATRTVPILYDPRDPSRSMVYWSDEIQRQASPRYLMIKVAVMGGILLALMLAIALAVRPAMRAAAARARPTA